VTDKRERAGRESVRVGDWEGGREWDRERERWERVLERESDGERDMGVRE